MSYYVTNENSVLNINNAHLKVSGNVMTDVMKLGAIEFAPPASNVAGTVNFTNVTTGVTTSSNLSVGGTLSLGTVEVVATTHTLANTTANGNVTPHTVQFSNATTGLVTTANVEVGGELTVSGNVDVSSNLAVSGSKFTYDNSNTTVFTGTATAAANEIGYLDMSTSSTSNNIHVKVYIKYGQSSALGEAEYSFYIRPNAANASLIYDYKNQLGPITPVVYRTNATDLHSGGTPGVVRFGYSIASAQNVLWRVEVQQRSNNVTFYPTNTGSAMVTTGLVQVTPTPFTRFDSNVMVSGNVGIGTTSPEGGLHVYGKTFILGQIASAPSGPDGTMYYNSTTKQPLVKVGGSWVPLVNFSPSNISGLVGWYLPENWTGTQWTDASAVGNHVTASEGTINYNVSHSGISVGANATFPVLYGDTAAELNFPTAILPSTYTLISMTRYNGSSKYRILDGQTGNWLSGHWGGKSGVAYHNGWLTPLTDRHGSNWVIGVDQNYLYRSKSQSVAWTNDTGGGGTTTNLRLGSVGYEASEWMCAELIVYNRTLSSDEYTRLADYMQNKYGIY